MDLMMEEAEEHVFTLLDWALDAETVWHHQRAVTPWPGAVTRWKGKRLTLIRTRPDDGGRGDGEEDEAEVPEITAAARQDEVAAYNEETETAGWGILNLRGAVQLGDHFTLGLGVENLFDKVYRDHLGGYNRVRDSDVPLGARIVSMGRNLYLKLNASW